MSEDWKLPFHLCLPGLTSMSVLLSDEVQTPHQGHVQIPYQLSLDSEIGRLTWLGKCSLWGGVSIIQKLARLFSGRAG